MYYNSPLIAVGNVIGPRGAVITDIQVKTGVRAVVNEHFPAGVNRQVIIRGTEPQVKRASDLVKKVVQKASGSTEQKAVAKEEPKTCD